MSAQRAAQQERKKKISRTAREEELISVIRLLLDNVDYTRPDGGCDATEMVGAVLSKEVILRANKAVEHA